MKSISLVLMLVCLFSCNKKSSTPEDVGQLYFQKILDDKDIEGSYALLSTLARSKISPESYHAFFTKVYSQPFASEVLSYEAQFRNMHVLEKKQRSETKFRVGYSTTWLEPWVVGAYLREKDNFSTLQDFIKAKVDTRASTLDQLDFKLTIVKEGDAYFIQEDMVERFLEKSHTLGKIANPKGIR